MRKIFYFAAVASFLAGNAFAVDAVNTTDANTASVESYDASGSVFQKISDLEQEKVLMQLEKEKAQLQLDLDRIAAEQARLVREQDEADSRAEEQQAEIERQKQAIENEKQKLDEQRRQIQEKPLQKTENLVTEVRGVPEKQTIKPVAQSEELITDKYFLMEIIGAGNQLVATVENLASGRHTKISVGKSLDGYAVKSISLDDGVELEKNGNTIVLNVGAEDGKANE